MKRRTRTFKSFQEAIVTQVHDFWRDHDHAHLRVVARELERLRADAHKLQSSHFVRRIVIRGWTTGASGLSVRALRKLNPDYSVRIRRTERPDAPRRNLPLRRSSGFEVVAQAFGNPRNFVFALQDRRGRHLDLPASNTDTAYKIAFLNTGPVQQRNSPVMPNAGYTDSIVVGTLGENRALTTWMRALVHNYPEELLDFIDSNEGRTFAEIAARIMRTFRANAQWADRYALSAFGERAVPTSNLQLIKIRRFDASDETSEFTLPEFVRDGSRIRAKQGSKLVPCPRGEWLHLEEATVQNGGTVLVGDHLIAYEAAADPTLPFVSGQWDSVFGSRMSPGEALLLQNARANTCIREGILLSGRNDANWYHWVVEYLPRLFQIGEAIPPSVPLLVTTRTPPTGMDLLRSLTSRPVIEIDPSLAYKVGVLHVVPPPVQVLDTTQVPWADGISMRPGPILELRNRMRTAADGILPTRRIFLRRTSTHRGLVNESVIASVARKMGFEEANPGTMSWQEQLELFASAKILVGASGAVMANYLCMAPTSRVLALTSSTLRDFVLPAALANLAGLSFSYVTGEPAESLKSVKHRRDWMHSNFSIDPDVFKRAMLAELATVRD